MLTKVIFFFINIYYLRKLYAHKEDFEFIEFSGDEKLALKFLHFYKEDIKTCFPDFNETQLRGSLNFVVLRDLVIANIFNAQILENADTVVVLNYTTLK